MRLDFLKWSEVFLILSSTNRFAIRLHHFNNISFSSSGISKLIIIMVIMCICAFCFFLAEQTNSVQLQFAFVPLYCKHSGPEFSYRVVIYLVF